MCVLSDRSSSVHSQSTVHVLQFTPILFLLDLSFFSHDYSSFSRHRPADSTCLRNRFLPSASLDFSDSSLITHYASLRFHRILSCSFCFVIVLELSESQVYKPSTRYAFPQARSPLYTCTLPYQSSALFLLSSLTLCEPSLVL